MKYGNQLPKEMQKTDYYYNAYDEKASEAAATRTAVNGKRTHASMLDGCSSSSERGPSIKLSKYNDNHNDSGIN